MRWAAKLAKEESPMPSRVWLEEAHKNETSTFLLTKLEIRFTFKHYTNQS